MFSVIHQGLHSLEVLDRPVGLVRMQTLAESNLEHGIQIRLCEALTFVGVPKTAEDRGHGAKRDKFFERSHITAF